MAGGPYLTLVLTFCFKSFREPHPEFKDYLEQRNDTIVSYHVNLSLLISLYSLLYTKVMSVYVARLLVPNSVAPLFRVKKRTQFMVFKQLSLA